MVPTQQRPLAIAALLIIVSMTAVPLPAQQEVPSTDDRSLPQCLVDGPIVILIGGNHSDPSPAQLAGTAGREGNSGLWRLKGDLLADEQLTAEYFNWNGTRGGEIDSPTPGGARRIARHLRQLHARRPGAPIILVGNSWGGHTAWQVCQLLAGASIDEVIGTQQSIDAFAGGLDSAVPDSGSSDADARAPTDDIGVDPRTVITIDLLVLLDPSSFGRGKEPMPTHLPANVSRAINYHTRNTFGWRGWLNDARLTNIDLGDSGNGYLFTGGPQYDSALNWSAHVSAEWDERIHAAIRRQIQQTLETPSKSTGTSLRGTPDLLSPHR